MEDQRSLSIIRAGAAAYELDRSDDQISIDGEIHHTDEFFHPVHLTVDDAFFCSLARAPRARSSRTIPFGMC